MADNAGIHAFQDLHLSGCLTTALEAAIVQIMDIRGFPTSLPEFQRVFPDDAACARYLEAIRWPDGFTWKKSTTTPKMMTSEMRIAARMVARAAWAIASCQATG